MLWRALRYFLCTCEASVNTLAQEMTLGHGACGVLGSRRPQHGPGLSSSERRDLGELQEDHNQPSVKYRFVRRWLCFVEKCVKWRRAVFNISLP